MEYSYTLDLKKNAYLCSQNKENKPKDKQFRQ